MTGLPKSLEAWKDELAIFPPDLALSVMPWLPRIALAVGPLHAPSAARQGAPDGFGGLARRGTYERLLVSEWLVALEAPDEFTRRAAMGEHAFLEIAHREPHGSTRSAALFDAGPNQLGSPRIAHLAALIVLHRRAKAAGAAFSWGILQDPDGWRFDQVTETSVLALIEARSPYEATKVDFEAWFERLQKVEAADDLWLIGGPRLGRIAQARGSQLEVQDVLRVGERKVRVAVRRRQRIDREIELDLPPERACVRLLRDPFEVVTPDQITSDPATSPRDRLVFSPDGQKLYARDGGDGVIIYNVPHSPRARTSSPRTVSLAGESLVAVTRARRSSYLITFDGSHFSIVEHSKRGRRAVIWRGPPLPKPGEKGAQIEPVLPGEDATLRAGIAVPGNARDRFLFVDGMGFLWRVNRWGPLQLVQADVVAMRMICDHLMMVISGATRSYFLRLHDLESADWEEMPNARKPIDLPGTERRAGVEAPLVEAFFGFGGESAHHELGFVAVSADQRTWRIYHRGGTTVLNAFGTLRENQGQSRVIGVAAARDLGWAPGLLLLDEGRRSISFAGRSFSRRLISTDAPITFACADAARPQVAWLTADGELGVMSIDYSVPLLRVPAQKGDPK